MCLNKQNLAKQTKTTAHFLVIKLRGNWCEFAEGDQSKGGFRSDPKTSMMYKFNN